MNESHFEKFQRVSKIANLRRKIGESITKKDLILEIFFFICLKWI